MGSARRETLSWACGIMSKKETQEENQISLANAGAARKQQAVGQNMNMLRQYWLGLDFE